MNTAALKARIILQGKSINELCETLGISRSAWFRKLSGTSEFTRSEIDRLRELLKLDDHETAQIFFSVKVS